MPHLFVLGAAAVGVITGLLARYFGPWVGFAIPALTVAIALISGSQTVHAEAAMGHGLEVMYIWLPLVGMSVFGCVIGLLSRRGQRRSPPK